MAGCAPESLIDNLPTSLEKDHLADGTYPTGVKSSDQATRLQKSTHAQGESRLPYGSVKRSGRKRRLLSHKNQGVRVLDAIQQGARTTKEIEAATGLPLRHCSAWTYIFEKRGIIEKTGQVRYPGRGRRANLWRIRKVAGLNSARSGTE